jgi:hypothetical protein
MALVCGLVEIFGEGLQVLIRETRYSRSRALFVGLNGSLELIIGGWLGEDLLASVNAGYVGDGFPDEMEKMVRNHKMCNMVTKCGSGFDDVGLVRVVVV